MTNLHRRRRVIIFLLVLAALVYVITSNIQKDSGTTNTRDTKTVKTLATDVLAKLAIKGRAPKTGYARAQFGNDWFVKNGCSMRNIILNRDMTDVVVDDNCNVTSGTLQDPYSGKQIKFVRGKSSSADVQIDHVVALSDAWQKGAQQLSSDVRVQLANDPLELLAVDGATNMQKGDGDAATWLPPNKAFRCQYVARQVAVKEKYRLWVTQAEHDAILAVLLKCPATMLPSP